MFKQVAHKRWISEEKIRETYIGRVPMKRTCSYAAVCNVAVFLVSDLTNYMIGQLIDITSGQGIR